MHFKYKHAILGGTFDRLHKGHKIFIDAAEKTSEKVTLGIVTDEFLGNRLHKKIIEPYEIREKELIKYLKSKKYYTKTIIHPLSDIYGPALKDPAIDVVLVIDESIENAKLINKERAKKGFPELEIVVVPMMKAVDNGFISSKRIRSGEIDRYGASFLQLFTNTLKMPEEVRPMLKKPFGKILKTTEDYKKVASDKSTIAVGDVVVANLVKAGFQANISIFDFKTQRQPITDRSIIESLPRADVKTKNEPSTISADSVLLINSAIRENLLHNLNYTIEVEGEEDLLAIPAILLSPIGTIVLYGISNIGGVAVDVTEEKKNEVKMILNRFDILKR